MWPEVEWEPAQAEGILPDKEIILVGQSEGSRASPLPELGVAPIVWNRTSRQDLPVPDHCQLFFSSICMKTPIFVEEVPHFCTTTAQKLPFHQIFGAPERKSSHRLNPADTDWKFAEQK